jgi:transposase
MDKGLCDRPHNAIDDAQWQCISVRIQPEDEQPKHGAFSQRE